MAWRFVQALGASPGLAVGSGVIGDIYKLEERGQAIGIYFGVRLFFYLSTMAFDLRKFRLSFWDPLLLLWQGVSFLFSTKRVRM